MSGLEQRAVDRVVTEARAAGVPIPTEILSLQARLEHGTGEPWRRWLELHPGADPDHPSVIGCCMGAAVYGPSRCTCWEPVYDVDQADPRPPTCDDELQTRTTRCSDCAYLRSSKERADPLTAEELLELPLRGERFWCHDGMRRPVAYRHPALGDVPASGDDWQPPTVAGVPFRTDGSPGLLCAGWAARRKAAT